MAERYRKFYVRAWTDDRFLRLSAPQPNGRYLWFYLLTNPSTVQIPGLYRAGEAAMAEELGWSIKDFRRCFAELEREGMARADWKARVVWVPKALRYDTPANSNVVMGWKDSWREIPSCALKTEAEAVLRSFCEEKGEPFAKAFADVCGDRSVNLPENGTPNGSGNGSPKKQPNRPPTPESRVQSPDTREGSSGGATAARRSRRVPTEFVLTLERHAVGCDAGLTGAQVDLEFAKFKDHEFDRPKSHWDGAWNNWVRNAVGRFVPRGTNGHDRQWANPKTAGNLENIREAMEEIANGTK